MDGEGLDEQAGWRCFYGVVAVFVAILTLLLDRIVPRRQPARTTACFRLLVALWARREREPILRRCALYQALCMGTFGVVWTSVSLRLALPPFDPSQTGIAVFALAGAVVTSIAGRAGDRGRTRPARILSHLGVMAAMALGAIGGAIDIGAVPAAVALGTLILAAVILDLRVIRDQTLGRNAINMLQPEARGRRNGLFTGLFFIGAALGSTVSGLASVHGGWASVCAVGGCSAPWGWFCRSPTGLGFTSEILLDADFARVRRSQPAPRCASVSAAAWIPAGVSGVIRSVVIRFLVFRITWNRKPWKLKAVP